MRLLSIIFVVALAACDNDPAEASVTNELPGVTIEKTWFRTTLFTDVIETGQTTRTLRVGVGSEPAYAIVRFNDLRFVARTTEAVDAKDGVHTRIVFSPTSSRSLCFGLVPLTSDEEELIRTRIFPDDDITSDRAKCGP